MITMMITTTTTTIIIIIIIIIMLNNVFNNWITTCLHLIANLIQHQREMIRKVWVMPKCKEWFSNVSSEGPSQRENIGGSKNTEYLIGHSLSHDHIWGPIGRNGSVCSYIYIYKYIYINIYQCIYIYISATYI